MAVYGKQFREKIGSNDSCLETWREFYNVLLETTLVELLNECSNSCLLEVDVQTCFLCKEQIESPWRMGNDLCNFRTMTHDTREVTFQYQRIF